MLRKKPGPLPPRRPGRPGQAPKQKSKYQTFVFDGDRFFKNKEYDMAFQIYEKACQSAPPGENYPYAQLCRCYRKKAKKALKKADFSQVVNLLEAMLEMNGERPNIRGMDHKILGSAYFELGQIPQAQKHLDLACELKPELLNSVQSMLNQIKAESLHSELNQMGRFNLNQLKGYYGDK